MWSGMAKRLKSKDSKPMAVQKKVIFLGMPAYGGVDQEAVKSYINATTQHNRLSCIRSESLLARNFNQLWCEALNNRGSHGLTHFSMIHADIGAEDGWLDKLAKEQDRVGADILSVIVPIKTKAGRTSTGVFQQDGTVRRLTLKEVYKLPVTFDIHGTGIKGATGLAVNTGLWICDFTKPWVEKVWFEIIDRIVRREDGKFVPYNLSEDWHFSSQCVSLGLRVFTTRCVKVDHYGREKFSNDGPWGTLETDED